MSDQDEHAEAAAQGPAPGQGPARSGWSAARVVAVVVGALLSLIGLALLTGGAALVWAITTQRDDDGYFTFGPERFATPTYAITAEDIDLGTDPGDGWVIDRLRDELDLRLDVTSVDPSREVFVGIARESDVERFLEGVARDEVDDIDTDPFRVRYDRHDGTATPSPPGDEDIWAASASGTGEVSLRWEPESGDWSIVLMNADASRGVDADVELGARFEHIWAVAIALLVAGLLALGGGVAVIVAAAGRARAAGGPPTEPPAAVPPVAPAAVGVGVGVTAGATEREPVVLTGHIDPGLSRWQWLVKWFLAIPHYVVLAFLWIAAIVATFVAGIAILFTGRYPRGLFDFTVGVLRWTWRVAFYATGVLGTDRYPPFSLGPEPDYPATLDVAYPEELSRGLVLVKWWLLAIPHYFVIGAVGAGWWWGNWRWGIVPWDWSDRDLFWEGGGLLGILLLIAAVRLLFTERYPREMFDLVMGLNRWIYRVAAYALLMTDRYPPFRLDQGPTGTEARVTGEETIQPG